MFAEYNCYFSFDDLTFPSQTVTARALNVLVKMGVTMVVFFNFMYLFVPWMSGTQFLIIPNHWLPFF